MGGLKGFTKVIFRGIWMTPPHKFGDNDTKGAMA